MIPIRKIALSPNMYQYKCPYNMTPTRIVIHNTANSASAENEIKYMQSNTYETSFHFAVDDKEAVQGIPLDRNAWHASDGEYGKGNREGIAIEICYSYRADENDWKRNYKAKFEKAQENAAILSAYLLHEYGWGCDLTRITKHLDYTDKYCPHRTLSDYGWNYFKNLVKEKYTEMYEGDAPMTAAEKKEFEALKKQVETLSNRLKKYDDTGVYDNAATKWAYIDGNLPDFAVPTIEKLVNKGYLKGNGANSLELSYLMLRMFVILDRAGVFD